LSDHPLSRPVASASTTSDGTRSSALTVLYLSRPTQHPETTFGAEFGAESLGPIIAPSVHSPSSKFPGPSGPAGLTRKIARRFNERFAPDAPVFLVPDALLSDLPVVRDLHFAADPA